MILFADTNILLDLNKIQLLREFMNLRYEVCIEESIFEDELLEPKEIQSQLLQYGLQCIAMSDEEFSLARKVYDENPKLSFYDSVAYAVAKRRGWDLLTGDKRLRRYAEQHGIQVYGLLWTMRACEKNEVDRLAILRALNKIFIDHRIRVPDNSVIAMGISILLRYYRSEKRVTDYYVAIN